MSSPVLNSTEFALVAGTLHTSGVDGIRCESTDANGSVILTARAILAVAFLGAGFWFMLWKFALHFWMLR